MKSLFKQAQHLANTNWKWVKSHKTLLSAAMAIALLSGCASFEMKVPGGTYPVMTYEQIAQNQYTAAAIDRDFNPMGLGQATPTGVMLYVGNDLQEPAPRGELSVTVQGPIITAQGRTVIGGTMVSPNGQVTDGTSVSVMIRGHRFDNGSVELTYFAMQGGNINMERTDGFGGETAYNSPLAKMLQISNIRIMQANNYAWDLREEEARYMRERGLGPRRMDYREHGYDHRGYNQPVPQAMPQPAPGPRPAPNGPGHDVRPQGPGAGGPPPGRPAGGPPPGAGGHDKKNQGMPAGSNLPPKPMNQHLTLP